MPSLQPKENIFLAWTRCSDIAPPEGRLLLLLTDRGQYHTGWFTFKKKGKYYFLLDTNSRREPRPAEWWWLVPEELCANTNPTPLPSTYSAASLADMHHNAHIYRANAEEASRKGPQIVPPNVYAPKEVQTPKSTPDNQSQPQPFNEYFLTDPKELISGSVFDDEDDIDLSNSQEFFDPALNRQKSWDEIVNDPGITIGFDDPEDPNK